MYIVTATLTRPNTSVDFPNGFDAETSAYIDATYKATGKLVSVESTLSEDQLTQTVVKNFADAEAHTEWVNDATLIAVRVARENDFANTGITRTATVKTV